MYWGEEVMEGRAMGGEEQKLIATNLADSQKITTLKQCIMSSII